MSILLRTSRIAARQVPAFREQVRFAHVENVVDHTLPFSVKNKPILLVSIMAFGIIGFGTPFAAAKWHMHKTGADQPKDE